MGWRHEFWIREIGIDLLGEPTRLRAAVSHRLEDAFTIAPHRHGDSVQLDLALGCDGRVLRRGRWARFSGGLAHCAYPGDAHGYELMPTSADAAVFHVKLACRREWMLVQDRALPALTAPGGRSGTLRELCERMVGSLGDPRSPRLDALLAVLELLRLWPSVAYVELAAESDGLSGSAGLVEHAVSVLERSFDEPPKLEDLAAEVGVSGRHLTRVFRATLGMTPHRYATIRRLDHAKSLLLRRGIAIGDVADRLGFSSHPAFARWFLAHAGVTPTAFRGDPAAF